ncbi:MAG: DMT family transporter [Burkholderiales bacterium]|jgi:drug/metabolite transporter (DMT)-like permease|nr:EamA family transporter [Rhodocyclaceae bacterium]MCA3022442.1 EamA family transporter [Rhodocyclaceae bacterium]MCA3039833.1 EamA family transporter [Rhodocyclaceae bacterium]MCA3042791.1 EamA family transporter [Rhodocyclaceae bacterium]MCA3052895.1 EamA family transporter [Rhodocyclaceae bacterium]
MTGSRRGIFEMHFSNLQLFSVCVLIWGSTWFVITFQLGDVAPELSVAYRFLIAAAALFVFCRWRGYGLRFAASGHRDLFIFGAGMFCVSYIFVYHAELYIVSGMVAVAYSASPMINMWASRVFFGTPITARVSVAAALGIVGIVCVFGQEFSKISASRNLELGVLFTVLSVLASSVGSMVAMRTQKRRFATWPSMAWGMLYGGALAFVYAMVVGRPITMDWSPSYVATLLYLALFGSIITFGCYLTLLKRIGAAQSSYVGVMVPVVALVVSFFFEKFAWGWMTTLGVALLLVGNVLMLRSPPVPHH